MFGNASARQRVALAILYAYLAAPIAIQAGIDNWRDPLFLVNAGITACWLALCHFSVKRPALLHLALLPLYLTTTADLFILHQFGVRLNSGFVTVILANRSDTADFLAAFRTPVLVAGVAFAILYIGGLYTIRGLRKPGTPKLAGAAALVLLAGYGGMVTRLHVAGDEPLEAIALDIAGHETSAPFGVIFQSAIAMHLDAENRRVTAQRAGFSFDARKPRTPDEEVYVWVIGESSRPENWSLFGYDRDTNPRLRKFARLVPLTRVMTTAPETRLAVPSMLSLSPITDWAAIQSRKSVVGAFDEAGFETHWLSTQEVDQWSGIVPQIAAEAKTVRFFTQSFDGALVSEFRRILALHPPGSGEKLFFVLHTKGNHFDYKRRYPPEFTRFPTSQVPQREEFINAYDNATLYTDWILAQLITMLDERNSPAVLLYSSDHGENLLDDERQLLGHIRGTPHDLSSAAFFWYSEEFEDRHPGWVSNLYRNAEAPLSLSNLPHSMLEIAATETPYRDLTMSVFNDAFSVRPRSFLLSGKLLPEPESLQYPNRVETQTGE